MDYFREISPALISEEMIPFSSHPKWSIAHHCVSVVSILAKDNVSHVALPPFLACTARYQSNHLKFYTCARQRECLN